MAFDPEAAFDTMLCAYRSGLMDALSAIQGEAVGDLMDETDLNMGVLLNRLDQVSGNSVTTADRLLGRSGFMFRYMANERLMRLAARLLALRPVRLFAVEMLKKRMAKWLEAPGGDGPGSSGTAVSGVPNGAGIEASNGAGAGARRGEGAT
jgi:hypothetical protein